MRSAILALMGFIICVTGTSLAADEDEFEKRVRLVLDQVPKEYVGKKSIIDIASLRQAIIPVSPEGAAVAPVIKLWNEGESDLIELAWWRQKDQMARIVILAIFYTRVNMEISGSPDFEGSLERFEPREAKQRKEEIEYVLANKELLHKLLAPLIE